MPQHSKILTVTAAFKPREHDKGQFDVTTVTLGDQDPCGVSVQIIRDGAGHVRHRIESWSRQDCLDWIAHVRREDGIHETVSTVR